MKVLCMLAICVLSVSAETLQLVQAYFRHGSRTPEQKDVYPTDPYTIEDYQPMGWGQLTNVGKQRAYQLGKLLRRRYDSFLGDIYTPDIAVTTSTDFDRTKMTALLVLAGLFPPAPSQKWHDELSWNPIPYHMDKAEYDYFIRRPTNYCPRYMKELQKVLSSDVALRMLKESRQVLDYIEAKAGKPMESLMDGFRIYQTLNAQANMNMSLPKWTESVYPDRVHALAGKQCYLENYNTVLKRLNGGRVLGRAIGNMLEKAGNSTNGRKIYLYSGHENNVVNILAALNLFEPHVPKYCAAVILELHYTENSHAVKVFYVRDVYGEVEEQRIEGCNSLCPLNKFVNITKPHVPVNYTAECESTINLG